MDDALVSEYRKQRAKHPAYPAHVCFAIARNLVKYRNLPTEWEQGGFDIKVTSDYDEDADLSWIGKYTSTYEDGAIDLYRRQWASCHRRHDAKRNTYLIWNGGEPIEMWIFFDGWEDEARRAFGYSYRYFVPAITYDEMVRDMKAHGKKGRGEARRLAREAVEWDLKMMEGYTQSWWMINVDVTASRAGVVLGRASIGGVEDGVIEGFGCMPIRAVAEEHGLIEEAIRDAEETLAAINRRVVPCSA